MYCLIVASCWALTGIPGCFIGGVLSDMTGRRTVLIISTIPFIMSIIMVALSNSLWQVLFSRCLAGLADGMMYPTLLGIKSI